MLQAVRSPAELITPALLPEHVRRQVERWQPASPLGLSVARALPYLPEELALEVLDAIKQSVVFHSRLLARVYRSRDSRFWMGDAVEEYGVVCRRVVTTTGVNFLVDAFQNLTEIDLFVFHGIGTGVGAEAVGNTALGTELTTEYNPNSTRATGTDAEGATANIYQTVATNTLDSGTPAVTEHGVFTSATVAAGTLLDRSVFAAISLDGTVGDGIQSTFELSCVAGG